jgi:hypothetical protein
LILLSFSLFFEFIVKNMRFHFGKKDKFEGVSKTQKNALPIWLRVGLEKACCLSSMRRGRRELRQRGREEDIF